MSIPPFLAPPPGVQPRSLVNDRGTFAALDNGELVAQASGTALLVPGFTGSKEDFIAVLLPLAARGLRAVAIDLAGQYESPAPSDGACSLAGFASDVWSIAESLPRPLVLVGHSFGGLVVREAILSNPLAADGLALIATGPAALPEAQQEVLKRFEQVMDGFGLDAVWQGKRAMDAEAGVPLPAPEIDAFLTKRFTSNDSGSLKAMISALCDAEDRTEILSAVAPPTVVVIGERDDVWPVEQQNAMADLLGAKVVSLPEAGHSPAVDAPDAVADAIASLQCFA